MGNENTEQLEVNVSAPGVELDDEMRADLARYFEGKSPDYINGYIEGVRDNSEALIADALVSVQATLPIAQYLAEITSGE